MAPTKTALIIVDVQNDFARPDGSLSVPEGLAIIPVINELRARAAFNLVVLTQDYHPPGHVSFWSTHSDRPDARLFHELDLGNGRRQMLWPDHCVQESRGAAFHSDLIVLDSDRVIRKGTDPGVDSYSAFMDNDQASKTELESVLLEHGITRVVVVGLAFDYCVGLTALDAKRAGFEVVVCTDATRSVSESTGRDMKSRMSDVGVRCMGTAEYLALDS